jgi:hypothetical protein
VPVDLGPDDVDTACAQLVRDEPPGRVGGALADEPRLRAELDGPRGHVRRLAACAGAGLGRGVRTRLQRLAEPNDDVEEEIAEGADEHAYNRSMEGDRKRSRVRSFALGSVVGASAALAAARRRRVRDASRNEPVGLKAFEGAPCYEEIVDSERYIAQDAP